jgi:methylamine dehydrogenase accessory protein MauD
LRRAFFESESNSPEVEMGGIWLASYVALWLLVLLLLLAVFTMARQIGLLHTRLGPSGARITNAGPEIGDLAPRLTVGDLSGREVTFGGAREKPLLILFITSSCSTCASLAPSIRALWNSERRNLDMIMVSLFSTEEQARGFVKKYKLSNIPCVVSEEVSLEYKVSSPPYGILLDSEGVVRSKGVVNHNEHIDSLLNVLELGHTSMEEWYTNGAPAEVAVADAATR